MTDPGMTDPGMTDPAGAVSPPRVRLPKIEQAMSAMMMNSEIATRDGSPLPEDQAAAAHPADKMLDLLVESETDVAGLIAYSLTERTRRDWIAAFRSVQRREPNAAEWQAFHLGEQLPRRLAAYRAMAAELMLRSQAERAGLGAVGSPAPGRMPAGPQTLQQAARSPVTWRTIGFMLLLLLAMAVVFRTAATWLFRA
ncbi:MAG: hypothetical protein IOC90_15275 [Methylocystis sp.]|nr:hypothetical protein [Methylocystis sp.]MCA3584360.1 hypothetical protein [Methylocystis sp.]MCA3589375.1 hypothetical protein [Methylocystis sp.]MCA3592619.1 hypothetical protein [Methylocystis sp.]